MKNLDLSYLCPHCKTKKQPRKRFGGIDGDRKIYICENCGHEFEHYELMAAQSMDIYSYKEKIIEKEFEDKKINVEELNLKLTELLKNTI